MRCCSKKTEDLNSDRVETTGTNPFITEKRKCTDMLCCLLFAIFWLGMIVIAGVGYATGEPEKLIYGVDWKGRTCGSKGDAKGDVPAHDLRDYKYLIYPRLAEDLYDFSQNNAGSALSDLDAESFSKFFGVCVRSCPTTEEVNASLPLFVHAYLDYTVNPDPVNRISSKDPTNEDSSSGAPFELFLGTRDVLYRCLDLEHLTTRNQIRCVDPCANSSAVNCGDNEVSNPFVDCGDQGCEKFTIANFPKCKVAEKREVVNKRGSAQSNPVYDQLSSAWRITSRWIGDVQKSAVPILLFGGAFSLFVGILWIVLLKYCAGCFVWITILCVLISMLGTTLFLAWKGDLIETRQISSVLEEVGLADDVTTDLDRYITDAGFQESKDEKKYWAIAAYVFMVMDALVLCLLIFICNRVRIAIGIIREASKAIKAMPFLLLFPLLPTLAILLLISYWVVTAAYIATSGKITLETVQDTYSDVTGEFKVAEYSDNDIMKYMLLYHLFGLLWTNQFLQSLGYITIAGAVSEYYWTLDKTTIRRMPIIRSFCRVFRYHLGTIAFGSLIIAVVQAIRLVLEYIDNKTRRAQEGNKFVKVALMCCKCFLWCFEKCLKFLNKNAYIVVAMKGTSFCTSIKEAFQLILANVARVATVGIISNFLLLLGKLFIVSVCCICMFLFIDNPPSSFPAFVRGDLDNISSPVFPMIITGILAYTVATFCLGVYETAIDTILLCFCEDCKVNKTSGTYYMSDELLAFVDGQAKKNAFRHYKEAQMESQV